MLTRLKVNGFKNLNDVDVWFGPFTCVAGANGVGKSNLFDAITFLRLLASQPLLEAATSIRDEDAKSGDVRSLFYRTPDGHRETMRFEAEMIVPKAAVDRRSRQAVATSTFLRYELELRYRGEDAELGPLEVRFEQLSYITKGDSPRSLPFGHSTQHWRDSWLVTRSKAGPFITTKVGKGNGDQVAIELRQDQNAGRPQSFTASALQRTVLSDVNATEAPTVVVARHEMMNWRLLQFEPSALRAHDSVRAPRAVGANGAHMPAALQHLIRRGGRAGSDGATTPTVPDVSAEIARRVSELVDDVRDVWVDEDPKRELLTLNARLADASEHPARSLSDGTLRFLALAIIEQTPQSGGLYCLEEPENGIHPERIPSMLKLLSDIATDPEEPVDDADNPLRQVIINTHSPAVVQQVPEESLVVAERVPRRVGDRTVAGLRFSALPNTWRTRPAAGPLMASCPMGTLLAYLNPVTLSVPDDGRPEATAGKRRVIDRDDARQYSLFGQPSHG
jgi:predicted ATPase